MPIDFSEFEEFNTEKLQEWESLQYSDADIARWKKQGVFVDKLYEFKMKKLFLEYLKVKLQNELAAVNQFHGYDPIEEAEKILTKQRVNDERRKKSAE